jgi:predicted exporter
MRTVLPRLWLGLLVTLSMAALLAVTSGVWPGLPVRTNIMELLPALRDDTVLLQALQRSNQAVSRKLLILVGDTDKTNTANAAALVEKSLLQQDFFGAPMTGLTTQQATDIGKFYYQWRQVLLSDQQHRLLGSDDFTALENQLTQAVYSPIGGINAALLGNDPLLTFYHFTRALPPTQGKIQSVNGSLQVHAAERDYRVLVVDIKPDVFDMGFHPRYQQWRSDLQQQLQQKFPDTELLLMGAVQHAVWGASSAKQEVSTIGNGSLVGIILLVMMVFSGGRALMASLLPLGTGVVAGLVVTLLCFGEVHLITLVFGSSVIGVAMDYSLHYLAEHYKDGNQLADKNQCLQRVFPGITMAMITSAIAYAAIGFAPFPVLRQIALFSCTGLFFAWLTVVSLYPRLLPPLAYRNLRYLRWSDALDIRLRHLFDNRNSRIALVFFTLMMIPGILRIHADDDLRLLQAPEASISAMEKRVQALTGLQTSGRFFLIEGDSQEQLLQRSEQLGEWLATRYPALSVDFITRYIPSQKRQQENFLALRTLHGDFAQRWREKIGFSAEVLAKSASAFANTPTEWLTPEKISAVPMGETLERFQLTRTERGWIAAGFISSIDNTFIVKNVSAFNGYASAHNGVHWMDPVADISTMFKHYREQTGWMMLLAYAVIAVLLCWRYRPAQAWRVMLAPVLAAWITLGLLGYSGVALNLFHVLALLLVLGVGIDYSIFFAESQSHRDTTMLAVVLSTITTLLSFGLLALSQTAAIRSFGIVVSIGMVCALLFSPLAQPRISKQESKA